MEYPRVDETLLNDQELAEEIYEVADDFNKLLREASRRRLYVLLSIVQGTEGSQQFDMVASPVYVKLRPIRKSSLT